MANSNTSLNGYEFGRSPKTPAPFWGGGSEGAAIDDAGIYTDKTWSSKKISDELAKKAEASDLANYAKSTAVYTKSQTYTKTEVDKLLENIPTVDAYTKTEVNTLLADKADKSDTYTKSQVNNLIPDVSGLATKTELNSGLATKANSDDVYSKSQTYTKAEVNNLIADIPAVDAYTKKQTDTLLSDKANVSDLANYAKTTSVYTKSQTYTKTEVDNLISQAGGGESGVKRFILKPYEISGIVNKYGAAEAFTHKSYMFALLTTTGQQKLPLILTKGDGSTIKVEIGGNELLPWNENETNSDYPKADAVYRKFSVGGMDFGICYTGSHEISGSYFPDVIIAVDASLDISSIAINTTDYTFRIYSVDSSYDADTPESLFRDYDAYPRKNEVWAKNSENLVRYQYERGLQYYQSYDNTWHNCLETLSNFVHIFDEYEGSILACSQFGNQVDFTIKLKSGVSFTANKMIYIGWCSKDPIGVDGIKINGFVYDGSSYFNIDEASCIIYKHSSDSKIYLGFKSNYTTTGNEIIRFSYLIDVDS